MATSNRSGSSSRSLAPIEAGTGQSTRAFRAVRTSSRPGRRSKSIPRITTSSTREARSYCWRSSRRPTRPFLRAHKTTGPRSSVAALAVNRGFRGRYALTGTGPRHREPRLVNRVVHGHGVHVVDQDGLAWSVVGPLRGEPHAASDLVIVVVDSELVAAEVRQLLPGDAEEQSRIAIEVELDVSQR